MGKAAPKDKMKLQSAKNNTQLVSRLYLGCQNQGGDLRVFSHENHRCPPLLSDTEALRFGSKSNLPILEKLAQPTAEYPKPTVAVIDGAAIVQMLKPGISRTFLEYSEQTFIPYLSSGWKKFSDLTLFRISIFLGI